MIDQAVRWLEAPLVLTEDLRPLDAIVVLGAPLGPGDSLTPVLSERVDAAAALWRAGGAQLVVASGGVTHGARRAEAEVIAGALADAGVTNVLVEPASRTTADNARRTRELVAPLGVRSVWLVTQPFHLRRARWLFREEGLDAHGWHISDSIQYDDRRRALRWAVREYGAWMALWARQARRVVSGR